MELSKDSICWKIGCSPIDYWENQPIYDALFEIYIKKENKDENI